MDMSYATVPVYIGEHLRLYIDVRFINIVYQDNQVINHPIYVTDQYFGWFTLATNDLRNPQNRIEGTINIPQI